MKERILNKLRVHSDLSHFSARLQMMRTPSAYCYAVVVAIVDAHTRPCSTLVVRGVAAMTRGAVQSKGNKLMCRTQHDPSKGAAFASVAVHVFGAYGRISKSNARMHVVLTYMGCYDVWRHRTPYVQSSWIFLFWSGME